MKKMNLFKSINKNKLISKKEIGIIVLLIGMAAFGYTEAVKHDFMSKFITNEKEELNSTYGSITYGGITVSGYNLQSGVDYMTGIVDGYNAITLIGSNNMTISGSSDSTFIRIVQKTTDSMIINFNDLTLNLTGKDVSPVLIGGETSVQIFVNGTTKLVSDGDNAAISTCSTVGCQSKVTLQGYHSLYAEAKGDAAAIGSDTGIDTGIISVVSGDITAISNGGAAIGAGKGGYSGNLNISGATLNLTSNSGYDLVGDMGFLSGSSFITAANRAVVYLSNDLQESVTSINPGGLYVYNGKGYIYSAFDMTTNQTFNTDIELVPVNDDVTFIISNGITLTNNKTLNNDNVIIENKGTVSNYGVITSPDNIIGISAENMYIYTLPSGGFDIANGSIFITSDTSKENYLNITYGGNSQTYVISNAEEIIITGGSLTSSSNIIIKDAPVNLTFNSLNMATNVYPLVIENSSKVNLTLVGANKINYTGSSDKSVIYMTGTYLKIGGSGSLTIDSNVTDSFNQFIESNGSVFEFGTSTLNLNMSFNSSSVESLTVKPFIAAQTSYVTGGRINVSFNSSLDSYKPILFGCGMGESCILSIDTGYINASNTYLGATKNYISGGSIDVAGAIDTAMNITGTNTYPVSISLNTTSLIQEYYIKNGKTINYLMPTYFENGKLVIFVPSGKYESYLINNNRIYSVDYTTSETSVVKATVTDKKIHIDSSVTPYFISDDEIFIPNNSKVTIGSNAPVTLEYGGIITPEGELLNSYDEDTVFVNVNIYYNNGKSESREYEAGSIIKLSEPTKTGYTFEGWFIDSELTVSYDFASLEEDVNIYAKWTLNSSPELEEDDKEDDKVDEDKEDNLEDEKEDEEETEEDVIERIFLEVKDNSFSYKFSDEFIKGLIDGEVTLLVFDTEIGVLTIDREMFMYFKEKYGSNVTLTFTKYLGDNPFNGSDIIITDDAVFKITLQSENDEDIYSAEGNLSVEVPFDTSGFNTSVYYLNENAIIKKLSGVSVDNVKQTVKFVTKYFTTYGVSLSEDLSASGGGNSSNEKSIFSEVNKFYAGSSVVLIVLIGSYGVYRSFKTRV